MSVHFDMNDVGGLDDAFASVAERLERLLGEPNAKRLIKQDMQPLIMAAKGGIDSITGNLESSVGVWVKSSAESNTEIMVGVSYKYTKGHHAHLVEGGHGYHTARPHPFWEPAVKNFGESCVKALEETLEDQIDKLIG